MTTHLITPPEPKRVKRSVKETGIIGGRAGKVLEALRTHGPLTRNEAAEKAGIYKHHASQCLSDLCRHELAERTDDVRGKCFVYRSILRS